MPFQLFRNKSMKITKKYLSSPNLKIFKNSMPFSMCAYTHRSINVLYHTEGVYIGPDGRLHENNNINRSSSLNNNNNNNNIICQSAIIKMSQYHIITMSGNNLFTAWL